jgi:hypothetical protein
LVSAGWKRPQRQPNQSSPAPLACPRSTPPAAPGPAPISWAELRRRGSPASPSAGRRVTTGSSGARRVAIAAATATAATAVGATTRAFAARAATSSAGRVSNTAPTTAASRGRCATTRALTAATSAT